MSQQYPAIVKRYLSSFIDSLFMLGMFIALAFLFPQDTSSDNAIRIAVFIAVFFCYEPLCVSFLCTLGQKITGIRVRRVAAFEKIPLPFAFVRYILKVTLGFISLFAIIFSKNRRAIHDFASDSIVIHANAQNPPEGNDASNHNPSVSIDNQQKMAKMKKGNSLAVKIAGANVFIFVVLGVLFMWGWNIFVDQAKVALNNNPVVQQHLGEILEMDAELLATGQEANLDVYIFRVEGAETSGVVRAEFVSVDDDTEKIVSGTLRLVSGESYNLIPVD